MQRRLALLMISLGILLVLSVLQPRVTPHSASTESVATSTASSTNPQANASPVFPSEPTSTVYLVQRVVDGDTIVVSGNGSSTTVRLIGIDTPETVKPNTPVQCYGPEASAQTKKMLTGVSVRLETDPTQDTYDKYHRLLAYVYLSDGTLFNEYMVRNGYAREYTYKKPYTHQALFKAGQKKAQQEGIGLWHTCAF